MELKCVIVDDEKDCRDHLRTNLAIYCPKVTIVAEAASVQQARELLTTVEPDLVFLDIHLKDGSGFDLLECLENRNFQVIFITAFHDHAIKAFELNALDYLLKPIGSSQLGLINDKIDWFQQVFRKPSRNTEDYLENRQVVLDHLQRGTQTEQLVIMQSQGMKLIRFDDIIYMEASGSYTIIHKTNNESVVASRGLRSFEKILDSQFFFRIHKSTIINVGHFQGYFFDNIGYVQLSNGERREVSRRKRQPLLDFMKEQNVVV